MWPASADEISQDSRCYSIPSLLQTRYDALQVSVWSTCDRKGRTHKFTMSIQSSFSNFSLLNGVYSLWFNWLRSISSPCFVMFPSHKMKQTNEKNVNLVHSIFSHFCPLPSLPRLQSFSCLSIAHVCHECARAMHHLSSSTSDFSFPFRQFIWSTSLTHLSPPLIHCLWDILETWDIN